MSDLDRSALHVIEAPASDCSLEDLLEMLRIERGGLIRELNSVGGILFRGFSIDGPEDFRLVLGALFNQAKLQSYAGGLGYKKRLVEGVYTSTELPAFLSISPHNELAYLPNPPRYVSFYCRRPARSGGRTPLVCGQRLYKRMPEAVRVAFEEQGICYTRTYGPNGLIRRLGLRHPAWVSWGDVFESEDPQDVEKRCAEMGLSSSWRFGKVLQTQAILPSTMEHPDTGEVVWFNQAHTFIPTPKLMGWPLFLLYRLLWCIPRLRQGEVHFANGKPIPRDMIDRVNETIECETFFVDWRAGDWLVLDNYRMMHGREAYQGVREVLAAMI